MVVFLPHYVDTFACFSPTWLVQLDVLRTPQNSSRQRGRGRCRSIAEVSVSNFELRRRCSNMSGPSSMSLACNKSQKNGLA